ncbi:MAG: hypothetical protein JWQ73_3058 [Variovorax sp.]|nr:hypothetical protein [Variovorax sp.]
MPTTEPSTGVIGATGVAEAATLAAHAALPLGADRLAAVAAILSAWLPDADALSRKMSAPQYQGLMPITVLAPAHAADAVDATGAGEAAP